MNLSTKWLITVIFAAMFCCAQTKKYDACEKALNLYSEAQKLFDHCAIQHAVPVIMCQKCIGQYVNSVQAFKNVSIETDPKSTIPKKCIDRFISHDELNIVWTQYQSTRDLWNRAACTSCFVESCDPDKLPNGSNVTETCKINSYVIEMSNRTNDLEQCLNNTEPTKTCVDCLSKFNLLAEHYQQFGRSSPSGICFDAVDQFNRTSYRWYDIEKCPRPQVIMSTGWVLMIIFISILISAGIIYGGFFVFTKYRQRGNYLEQIDSDNGTVTPPIMS